MKNLTQTLISFGAFAAAALVAQAQPAPKILIVDMAKIFDNHYETKAEKTKLDEASQKAQAEIDSMNKEGNALVAEYKELDEQSKSPMATAEAKSKAQGEAQKKGQQIQAKMQDINTFANNAKQSIQQRIQTFRSMMMEEISKVVVEIAKRHGASIVLDKSGPSLLGVPPVIYFDPSYDITPEVIAQIDQNRPASAVGSSSPSVGPSSSSSGSSSSTPQITIPGIGQPAK